jgi:hypothetical protein
LDEAAAAELAYRVIDYARKKNAVLLVVTSPRTSRTVTNALARMIAPPDVLHIWSPDLPGPYRRVLAEAGEIIVTSDSVSMAADAVATGKPVSIYRLPRRWTLAQGAVEKLYRWVMIDEANAWLKPLDWVFTSGLLEPCPDRVLLFDRLFAEGRVGWFGSAPPGQTSTKSSDLDIASAALEALFK